MAAVTRSYSDSFFIYSTELTNEREAYSKDVKAFNEEEEIHKKAYDSLMKSKGSVLEIVKSGCGALLEAVSADEQKGLKPFEEFSSNKEITLVYEDGRKEVVKVSKTVVYSPEVDKVLHSTFAKSVFIGKEFDDQCKAINSKNQEMDERAKALDKRRVTLLKKIEQEKISWLKKEEESLVKDLEYNNKWMADSTKEDEFLHEASIRVRTKLLAALEKKKGPNGEDHPNYAKEAAKLKEYEMQKEAWVKEAPQRLAQKQQQIEHHKSMIAMYNEKLLQIRADLKNYTVG